MNGVAQFLFRGRLINHKLILLFKLIFIWPKFSKNATITRQLGNLLLEARHSYFKINSMFWTTVLYFLTCHVLTNVVRVIEGKFYRKWPEGKQKLLLVYSGRLTFELSRAWGKKSILVRVSARFELARVRSYRKSTVLKHLRTFFKFPTIIKSHLSEEENQQKGSFF